MPEGIGSWRQWVFHSRKGIWARQCSSIFFTCDMGVTTVPILHDFRQLWPLVSWKQILLSLSTLWVLCLSGSLGWGVLPQQSWPWTLLIGLTPQECPGGESTALRVGHWRLLLNLSCRPLVCFVLNWDQGWERNGLWSKPAKLNMREVWKSRAAEGGPVSFRSEETGHL